MSQQIQKIIYIADPEILAVPIIECGEPLVDIKHNPELQYGPPPECSLTAPYYTKIRRRVFEKLCLAQKDLPKGWHFRLYEGFRSLQVQQILFEQEYKRVMRVQPDKTHEFYFRQTTSLVSPVINLDGTKNIPAHNTGGAIDIEIITEEGELIDMGMTAADWIHVDPEICATACTKVSGKAQRNRQLLLTIMQAQGFVNYPTEWWHFSYGDRYWAYYQPIQKAIYGSAEEGFINERM